MTVLSDFEKLQALNKQMKALRQEIGMLTSERDELQHQLAQKAANEKLTPAEKTEIKKTKVYQDQKNTIKSQQVQISDLKRIKNDLICKIVQSNKAAF